MGMIAATLAVALLAQQPPHHAGRTAAGDSVPLYTNLGDHHYSVTTSAPRAQAYFDQGLRLYYAFNHGEAIRSFRAAQRLDPACAMCWWGEALAWGPNINLPMDSTAGVSAFAALERARSAKTRANPRERAFIDALARRYVAVPPAQRASLDSAYAAAMAQIASRYPDDAEASVLYAESLMDLRPWNYWAESSALVPEVAPALEHLERVMGRNARHPGACHFYIHLVEEKRAEQAVPCAERLAELMPGAGHLVHMPGHIYIRVGRYADAIRVNQHAVHADESYIRDQRPAAGMYTNGYYPHNYDFMAFAAAMAGQRELAVKAAEKMASLVPAEMLGQPGMAYLQHYIARPLQMRVRFADWQAILRAPVPAAELRYTHAIWRYARGRALAGQGSAADAEGELVQLRGARAALQGVRLEFNQAPDVLGVAEQVLAGHIAAARGDYGAAARALAEAARLEDALVYGEPPEWSVPVRQELGSVLLAAGRTAEAKRAFEEDLARFPENGWSLKGLERALRAQGRLGEAAAVAERLRRAWPDVNAGGRL